MARPLLTVEIDLGTEWGKQPLKLNFGLFSGIFNRKFSVKNYKHYSSIITILFMNDLEGLLKQTINMSYI